MKPELSANPAHVFVMHRLKRAEKINTTPNVRSYRRKLLIQVHFVILLSVRLLRPCFKSLNYSVRFSFDFHVISCWTSVGIGSDGCVGSKLNKQRIQPLPGQLFRIPRQNCDRVN